MLRVVLRSLVGRSTQHCIRSRLAFLPEFQTVMTDDKVIVAVRSNGVLPCGDRVDLQWIATRCQDSFRWDLRRVFDAAGYKEVSGSGKTKFCNVYNRIHESIRPVVFSLFGGEAILFGRSWHAERMRGTMAMTFTSSFDNHWCSTIGLLVLLTFLPGYRKHPKDQQRACMLARMFLEATVERDVAMQILASKPPAQAMALCDCEIGEEGFFCKCIGHLMAKKQALILTEPSLTSQAVVAQLLFDIWGQRECPACSAWAAELLKSIAQKVDDAYAVWDVFNIGAVKDLLLVSPSGKRRRINSGLKDVLMHDAITKTSGESTAKHVAGLGLNVDESVARSWERAKLCERKAARWATFEGPQSFSIAFDAARIGKPARNIIAGVIWGCKSEKGAMLTPQVRVEKRQEPAKF